MAQYQTILASEYSEIRNAVAKVLGETPNQSTFGAADDDYGYGQILSSSAVPDGTPVTAQQWQNLTNDMLRCLYHQNGTNSSTTFASTENVLVGDSLGNTSTVAVTSGFPYSTTVNTTLTATSAITNYLTVDQTAGMNIGMTITFTNVSYGNSSIGGLSFGTTYYIFNIINATSIQVSTTVPSSTTTAVVLTTATAPSGSITATASGSKGQFILEKDRLKMYQFAISNPSNIQTNRLTVFSGTGNGTTTFTQLEAVSYPSLTRYISAGSWQGTKSHTFTLDFGSGTTAQKIAAARYFFNAGGEVRIAGSYEAGNVSSPTIDYTWENIFSGFGTFIFRARSCAITGSATEGAIGSSPNTTYVRLGNGLQGFYSLSSSQTTVLRVDPPSSTAYENSIYYNISATFNGGLLTFLIDLVDTYAPGGWGISEPQTGAVTSTMESRVPRGLDLNGNNTVVIPYPTAGGSKGTFDF